MSISEGKMLFLEYYVYSIQNCQQVKQYRMVQSTSIPPLAFKAQNTTFTEAHSWTKQTCLAHITLNAAVDDSGSLAQLPIELMLVKCQ